MRRDCLVVLPPFSLQVLLDKAAYFLTSRSIVICEATLL
jgi:hypothetical protein